MGWGSFFDKLISKLPIPNRVEGWKNQVDKLEREQSEILKQPMSPVNDARLRAVRYKLNELYTLLKNKAQD